jgi:hypothetical protein
MELLASTLHTTSEHGESSITTADAHTSAASSRLNWRPCLFKWTRPFRRNKKSGFCACAITSQTQSTYNTLRQSTQIIMLNILISCIKNIATVSARRWAILRLNFKPKHAAVCYMLLIIIIIIIIFINCKWVVTRWQYTDNTNNNWNKIKCLRALTALPAFPNALQTYNNFIFIFTWYKP